MIYFRFNIDWPWPRTLAKNQTDYIEFDKLVTTNKALSIQLSKSCNFYTIFGITIDTQMAGQDHAGLKFELELLSFFFIINFYDRRHWNWEDRRWQTDEEAQAEHEEWKRETGERP